jgi:predicted esterase
LTGDTDQASLSCCPKFSTPNENAGQAVLRTLGRRADAPGAEGTTGATDAMSVWSSRSRGACLALALTLAVASCLPSRAAGYAFRVDARDEEQVALGRVEYPEPVVLGPINGSERKAVVILLHGLGGAAKGMEYIFEDSPFDNVQWIFPVAPTRPVTLNYGQPEPAWYDMRNLDPATMWDDRDNILASAEYIRDIVYRLVREGVPPKRIVLGGFSQGGAVALTCAVHALDGVAVGGVVALSTYLPMHDEYLSGALRVSSTAKDISFFLAHGDADPVLDVSLGKTTEATLWTLGARKLQFHLMPNLGHDRNDAETALVKQFIEWLIVDTF